MTETRAPGHPGALAADLVVHRDLVGWPEIAPEQSQTTHRSVGIHPGLLAKTGSAQNPDLWVMQSLGNLDLRPW